MGVKVSITMDNKAHLGHNRRDKKSCPDDGHIDWIKTKDNKILADENVRQAYDDVFGEAVREYNAKERHIDRKISSYYDKVKDSKQLNTLYEIVVQVGSVDNPVDDITSKQILEDYYKQFIKANPQLHVTGAYIHMDEATPHMHLDFFPVAEYTKGMKKRNGLDRALSQTIGRKSASTKDTVQNSWQNWEREKLRDIALAHGIETDEIEYNYGSEKKKHLDTPQYKETMDKAKEDLKKVQEKEQELLDKVNKKIELVEKKSAYDYVSAINGEDRQWYRAQKVQSEGILGGGMQYKKVPINMIKEFELWMARESVFAQGQRVKQELAGLKSEISELMGMKPAELQINEINQQKIKLEKENINLKGKNAGLVRKNRQMSGFIEAKGLTKDFSKYIRKMRLKPLTKGLVGAKVAGIPGQIADKALGAVKIGVKAGVTMFNAFKSEEEKQMEAERMTSRKAKNQQNLHKIKDIPDYAKTIQR